MRPWVALGLGLALGLGGCALLPEPPARLPGAPIPFGSAVAIDGAQIPLDPQDPAHKQLGRFTYAGGLALTSRQTSRLGGLSDLKFMPDGRLLAQSDQSDLLDARIVLDGAGRLAGLADAHIRPLPDEHGVDLYAGGQKEYDSEGLAILPNGDRLTAFEQHDRVLRYPAGGGLPVPARMPQVAMRNNEGMEGLAQDPTAGPDAYRVAIEATGQTFLCHLSSGCVADRKLDLEGMAVTALEMLPGGRMAYLLRSYNPAVGNTSRLRIVDQAGKVIDGFELKAPLVHENFEGLAALPEPGGRIRFYMVSDDNFGTYDGAPTGQKTLLLAFDWSPP